MQNRIDEYVNRLLVCLYKTSTCDRAWAEIDPLLWWINTGRASTEFLRKLLDTKPYLVARRLRKGGSHEEVINRIFSLLRLQRG